MIVRPKPNCRSGACNRGNGGPGARADLIEQTGSSGGRSTYAARSLVSSETSETLATSTALKGVVRVCNDRLSLPDTCDKVTFVGYFN